MSCEVPVKITITLTDDEVTALRTVEADPKAWADRTVRGRATATLDAIVSAEIAYLMRHEEPLPPNRSEILASAVKAGRAMPVADMAQVDFAKIGQSAETEAPVAEDPLAPVAAAAATKAAHESSALRE